MAAFSAPNHRSISRRSEVNCCSFDVKYHPYVPASGGQRGKCGLTNIHLFCFYEGKSTAALKLRQHQLNKISALSFYFKMQFLFGNKSHVFCKMTPRSSSVVLHDNVKLSANQWTSWLYKYGSCLPVWPLQQVFIHQQVPVKLLLLTLELRFRPENATSTAWITARGGIFPRLETWSV